MHARACFSNMSSSAPVATSKGRELQAKALDSQPDRSRVPSRHATAIVAANNLGLW
jgi:hypothetical protein